MTPWIPSIWRRMDADTDRRPVCGGRAEHRRERICYCRCEEAASDAAYSGAGDDLLDI